MRRTLIFFSFLLGIVLLSACSDETGPAVECTSDSQCTGDLVCRVGRCLPPAAPSEIVAFTAEPSSVAPGETTTLSWEVTSASNGVITWGENRYEIPVFELRTGTTEIEIEADTTFVLTAQGNEGELTQEVTVTLLVPQAEISSFSADPELVQFGESSTLLWQTTGATSGEIVDENDALVYQIPTQDLAAGSFLVTPQATTSLTLRVENAYGSTDEETVMVEVRGGLPVIDAFDATPAAVLPGGDVTLAWTVRNADLIRILNEDGDELTQSTQRDGMFLVTVQDDTTFTLIATNARGSEQSTQSVAVVDPLVITAFTATPSQIPVGGTTTLSWAVTGDVQTITITGDDGSNISVNGLNPNGDSVNVMPTANTAYTLTVGNVVDTISAMATVEIVDPPVINAFNAAPTTVLRGDSTTLTWDTTGADSIALEIVGGASIDITGLDPAMDMIAVAVNADVTYRLSATNIGGTTTQDVLVVAADPPQIDAFTALPLTVAPGEPVTLSWQTSFATGISIFDDMSNVIDVSGANIAADSVVVNPTVDATYTLTAIGFLGMVTSAVQINVETPVTIQSFFADALSVTVGDDVTLTWAAPGATGVAITYVDGLGATQTVDLTGTTATGDSVTFQPTETATYTLTAAGFRGPVTDTLTVVVNPAPVTIDSFAADAEVIAAGASATLSWTTSNASGLTLTDDQGGTYDISALNFAADSLVVSPSNPTTTYTLSGTNGVDTVTESVIVRALPVDALKLSEVFYNAAAGDGGYEWIEIHNDSDEFVDLQFFSIGAGGVDYTTTTVQLAGVVPPRGCFVVGGPTSDATNGSPQYDQVFAINPNLQNGGGVADGVALFFELAADLDAATVPLDAAIYGTTNSNSLLDPAGAVGVPNAPVVTAGNSFVRVSESVFVEEATPNPGACFAFTGISPSASPNSATGVVSISGYGLNPLLHQVVVGTTILQNCAATAAGLDCEMPVSMDSGVVDATVTQIAEYIDGNGNPILQGLAPADQTSIVLSNAYTFEIALADPGATFYCGIQDFGMYTALAGDPIDTYLEIYVDGSTVSGGDIPAGWAIEATYYPVGADVFGLFDPTPAWTAAAKVGNSGNNAVYFLAFTENTAQSAEVAYRVTPDGGISYYYCDTMSNNGSDDGYSSGLTITWN